MSYPIALAVTIAVELPVYVLVLRALGLSWVRASALAVAVNALTHPVVWLVVAHAGTWRAFVVAELTAWLVEFAVVYALVRRSALLTCLAALVANTASGLAGLLLSLPS